MKQNHHRCVILDIIMSCLVTPQCWTEVTPCCVILATVVVGREKGRWSDQWVNWHNNVDCIHIVRCFHITPSISNNIHINKRYTQNVLFCNKKFCCGSRSACCWFDLFALLIQPRCILRGGQSSLIILCIFWTILHYHCPTSRSSWSILPTKSSPIFLFHFTPSLTSSTVNISTEYTPEMFHENDRSSGKCENYWNH